MNGLGRQELPEAVSHDPAIQRANSPLQDQLPELSLPNHRHLDPLGSEAADLDELRASVLAGDLLRVRAAAHEDVRRRTWLGLHECARLPRRGDRVRAWADEEPG